MANVFSGAVSIFDAILAYQPLPYTTDGTDMAFQDFTVSFPGIARSIWVFNSMGGTTWFP